MKYNKTNKVKNFIINEKNGDYVGFIDKCNNIYCTSNSYFGTIQTKNKIFFLPLLFVMLLFTFGIIMGLSHFNLYNQIQVYQIDSENYWNTKTPLDIFKNPRYDNKKIIAPSDTGKYDFFVENVAKKDIKINILLEDINPYKLNMKYRLKQEEKYVIGNENTWESIESMKLKEIKLSEKQIILYTLEWKLEDIPSDKIVNKIADYSLQITINGY